MLTSKPQRAGIYIHIPFCRKACHYCNFHFSTLLKYQVPYVDALLGEIDLRRELWREYRYDTIYFGGGTPSLLSMEQLERIMDRLYESLDIVDGAECTIEANPDDIDASRVSSWKAAGMNRISLGIQSFDDRILRRMNRSHRAVQALKALEQINKVGIQALSVDLIYGMPGMNISTLERDMDLVLSKGVQHISAYALTIEPHTAFYHFVRNGDMPKPNDEEQVEQFYFIRKHLRDRGFVHYEISNYARPGYIARHNSAYWQRIPYLGLGAGAHSLNGRKRSWNISNNAIYIRSIEAGKLPEERELLTEKDLWNEFIMTGIRTKWGVSKEELNRFSYAGSVEFKSTLNRLKAENLLSDDGQSYVLTEKGLVFADGVATKLFVS